MIDWDTGEKRVFRLQTATRLTGKSSIALNLTDASANDHDEGYTAELRLPWFGLGVQRSTRTAKGYDLANEKIRILAMLRDGSQPNCYFASGRIEEGAYVQLQISHWPLFVLAP
ncbi:MAG: hypothetical protein D6820_03415 [Lentisphaerae bacterium]|nr:MAG: hypothetical protein D6820_03415 [Lentisphaerota bacterium]